MPIGEILREHCSVAKTADDGGPNHRMASIAAERILDGMTLGMFSASSVACLFLSIAAAVGVVPGFARIHWSHVGLRPRRPIP
jgi:hypothetical protein